MENIYGEMTRHRFLVQFNSDELDPSYVKAFVKPKYVVDKGWVRELKIEMRNTWSTDKSFIKFMKDYNSKVGNWISIKELDNRGGICNCTTYTNTFAKEFEVSKFDYKDSDIKTYTITFGFDTVTEDEWAEGAVS